MRDMLKFTFDFAEFGLGVVQCTSVGFKTGAGAQKGGGSGVEPKMFSLSFTLSCCVAKYILDAL